MRLLVAIPVFNEQKYVREVIRKVMAYSADVLVVDDASTDGTPTALRELAATHPRLDVIRHAANGGYGRSLIDAFAYAAQGEYDWVITMDCDEQHEPAMIPTFIDEIAADRWDLISGSRYRLNHSDDQQAPTDRLTINRTLTATLNRMYGWQLTDAFCGFKAHRVSAMRGLDLTEPGYAFPMQLWPQVAFHNLRMTELPVRRIYLDPTRHFGGTLDDPSVRLNHYLEVLHRERVRLGQEPAGDEAAPGQSGSRRHGPGLRTTCSCCQ